MKNKLIRLLALTLLLNGVSFMASGQPYYFRHYQVENGISNNTVFCAMQDSSGFMWFGTKDGLTRFDGYHYKVFYINYGKANPNFTPDYVFSLYAENNGQLWVGAEGGLFKFNAEKEVLEPFIDSLHYIWDVQKDKYGQLWFISANTLYRYNFQTKLLKQFSPRDYFSVTSLCISNDSTIYIATTTGLLAKFNENTGSFTSFDVFVHSPPPTSRWIQKIKPGNKNSIFIGTTGQGMKQFNTVTSAYKDVLTYNPDQTTIFVRDILKNADNEFWIATESGIFILNTDTWAYTNLKKTYLDPYSLNDNAIYTLCRDKEGGIWAGTYFGGVNYYTKQNSAFIKYFPDHSGHSISGNVVREICRDQYKNLWIGTEDGGLNKIDDISGNVTHYLPTPENSGIAYTNIHGLLADGDELWIGTFEHGIDIMDIPSGKIKKRFTAGPGDKQLKSNFALCFIKTSTGEIIIGTSSGLYSCKNSSGDFDMLSEVPGNFFISALVEDHNKTVWVGTHDHGVYWFNLITKEHGVLNNKNRAAQNLENKTINDIYEDSNNNVWFATEGEGVCRLSSDRKNFTWINTQNGLPGNFVFKVLEDNFKSIWISTSKGLVEASADLKRFNTYTQANGLLNNQFNYHSGYKDENGRLYFGSVKGMISFNPAEFSSPKFTPPLFITGLQAFNEELPVSDSSALKKSILQTSRISLPYYQSSLSIDFAALSYVSPEMIGYRYTLDGLDDHWTNITTNRKVYFTNLSPGNYTFKLRSYTNGKWNQNEKQLLIHIRPPFWATWWAFLIYVIIAVAAAYYLFSTYHERIQSKKEKEIYESKIEFFTNVVHEIKTPLTLIKGPVENLLERQEDTPALKEDIACLDRNTNRLMNLVSQILDFRQTEINGFSLYFSKVNINELLRETWLSFELMAKAKKLRCDLLLPPNEVYCNCDAEALRKIFSNLMSNAVKYGINKITVKLFPIDQSAGIVKMHFENDGFIIPAEMEGKIFEPFQRLKETASQKGTGIGLTLARSLAELHKGHLVMQFLNRDVNIFELTLPVQSMPVDKPVQQVKILPKHI